MGGLLPILNRKKTTEAVLPSMNDVKKFNVEFTLMLDSSFEKNVMLFV